MNIWMGFQIMVLCFVLMGQESSKKVRMEKFLENVMEKLKKIRQERLSRFSKKVLRNRRDILRKNRIKKQIFEKLTLPYVYQSRSHLIRTSKDNPRKENKVVNGKDEIADSGSLSSVGAGSEVSATLHKIFKDNPALMSFKFPAPAEFLKKVAKTQGNDQDGIENKSASSFENLSLYDRISALKDWYLEVLENVRNYWF